MIIKSIELNNFRIYRGVNKIDLTPDGERNIIIVSGNNGFGKTTFLMSLVWCLYGKNMEKVDELYKKEIDEKGSYSKYIGNSLNTEAAKEGETRFSVTVTFTDVQIPNITCTEISILRSYDRATSTSDELAILIDGRKSDLFNDKDEEELFIRDYILPIEIAKFFFFDAEKIVTFAQVNTPLQRAELSQAYSQVLGIQKYADLKDELEKIKDTYREEAAKPNERKEFEELKAAISSDEIDIDSYTKEINEKTGEITQLKYECNELQEKLIREGDLMSMDKLNELRDKQQQYELDVNEAQEGLKDLYTFIPFGLAGQLVSEIVEQVTNEKAYRQNKLQLAGVKEKTDEIISDLNRAQDQFSEYIDTRIKDFYKDQVKTLILKYFYSDVDVEKFSGFQVLHDFTDLQYDDFMAMVSRIKDSKSSFELLHNKYAKAKAELYSIQKTIREAEKNAESDYIKSLREKKSEKENTVAKLEDEIVHLRVKMEQAREKVKAAKQRKEILNKKIEVSKQNKAVDDQATLLIQTIQQFLIRFKEEKKKALESSLQERLSSFLHKKDLVHHVVVDIQGNGEDVDISLFNADNRVIDKGILSMGERQMFASALLAALVEETGLDFPVFIDSPMQKFDVNHSQNILTKFYPQVSKQVILFPLLMKELTEQEYALIDRYVNKAFLIEHSSRGSSFCEVRPEDLFETYKRQ